MRDIGTWLLLFHVLAGLWLATGSFAGAVVRRQILRSDALAEKVAGLKIAWRLLVVYTVPGATLVGILGIGLIHPRGWSFRSSWIHVSLLLWAGSLAITLFYLLPRLKKTLAAGERASGSAAAAAEFARLASAKAPAIVADLNALAVVVLSFLMVFKP